MVHGHGAPTGAAAAFMMRPSAISEHVEIVVVHSPAEREAEARLRTRDDMANWVNQNLETGPAPVANWAPNQVLARRAQEDFCGTLSAKGAWRAGNHSRCGEPRSRRTDC